MPNPCLPQLRHFPSYLAHMGTVTFSKHLIVPRVDKDFPSRIVVYGRLLLYRNVSRWPHDWLYLSSNGNHPDSSRRGFGKTSKKHSSVVDVLHPPRLPERLGTSQLSIVKSLILPHTVHCRLGRHRKLSRVTHRRLPPAEVTGGLQAT